MTAREPVTALDAPAALGPYTHAIACAGLLFCSGQIALDPRTGELLDGGPQEQAGRCLENLAAVCSAAGASLADAVSTTVYVTDPGAFAEVDEVYAAVFATTPAPARVAVAVSALPRGAAVEIAAVIALPG